MEDQPKDTQNLETSSKEVPQKATESLTEENNQKPTNKSGFLSRVNKRILILVSAIGIIVLIILASFLLLSGNKEAELLTQANSAYLGGDFKQTYEKLEEANSVEPNNSSTLTALVNAIANDGSLKGNEQRAFEKGKSYADEIVANHSNDADALTAAGYLYETAGKYTEALELYERALVIEPNNANTLFHKGHVLEFLNRQVEAYEIYSNAYELEKNDPFILMAYAKVLVSQGNGEEALSLYKTAASLPSTSTTHKSEAYTNASILARSSIARIDEALELAELSFDTDPNYAPGLANYGFIIGAYYGKLTEGIANLIKATELNPRISQNFWYLGSLYRLQENYPAAIESEKKAVELVEQDNTILGQQAKDKMKSAYLYDLATTYSLSGQDENAIDPLSMAISLNPPIKINARNDYNSGYFFKTLSGNQQFLSIIE